MATNNISAGLSKSIVKSSSDCIVTVSTDSLATSATDTRTQQVSIKAPNGCAWSIQTASDTPGMLTPTLSSGVGDATLNVATSANGSSADRSAQITVTVTTPSAASSSTYDTSKAGVFEDTRRVARTYIRQTAAKGTDTGCTSLSLNRNSERQGANIINGGVTLLAPTTSCTWTSTVDQSWVAITQGAGGKGTGSINYQLQANPTAEERTAVVTIKGSATTPATTLTIIQAANTTNLVNNGGAEGGSGDGGGDGGAGASGGGGEGPGGE